MSGAGLVVRTWYSAESDPRDTGRRVPSLKILRIITRLNVGGPARHVTLLNAGLQARGHDTVLVHGALDEGEASLEGAAITGGIRLAHHAHLGRRLSGVGDLQALAAVIRLVFHEQPDVVHTHTAKAGTLGRLAALIYNATRSRSRRALVVHTFHGHVFEGYFSPLLNRFVRLAERGMAWGTDVVVTISTRQWHDIVERFAIAPASKTVVVPLGLDLDPLTSIPAGAPSLRAAIGAAADDLIIGFAGRMVKVKDLPTLVRAFAQAQRAIPALRMVLAGDGPERASAQAIAADLGVCDRLHFLGWVKDLPRFYATVDIFALSSISEGTPVAVIEAMAAKRAVVATAVGGVPDVVESGVTGLLVAPQRPEALSDALVQLATNPERRLEMGRAGRARTLEMYSMRRLVDDIEGLYSTALAEKRK